MSRRLSLTAWGLIGLVLALLAGTVAFDIAGGEASESSVVIVIAVTVILSNLLVGAILALRRPGNSIGWILLANAAFLAAVGFTTAYADYALNAGHPGLPLARWAVLFEDRTWPAFFLAATAISYVFPDGGVPPERRRMAKLTGASFALLLVSALFSADQFAAPFEAVPTPLPGAPEPVVWACFLVGMAGALAGMIWVAAALRRSYRSAIGTERLQLRWLSVAAATVPLVIAVCIIDGSVTGDPEVVTFIALSISLTTIPVAIGIAVMRYRLYEIDRVINRSLVYFALTVVLAATFAAVSIGVGVVAGGGSTVPTAVATLVVVLAFNPVRGRIQRQVDRRFNRARYEGLRRVERFLADLRSGAAAPEAVEGTLAEALGDPQLELLYWISPQAPYVDTGGVPRRPDIAAGRLSTPVTRGTLRLGTVVHDERVAEQPDLLASVVEAAGLAIEIGRLRVEVRQRLAEVEDSRARIVAATIEERRRLERDLHDGAQQRLVSIGLDLRHIQGQLGSDRNGTSDALDDVVGDLGEAIAELRELARGVRPPALDDGLAAALELLGSRAPLPTVVEATPERIDPDLEAAAYFVASEALTNAAKHSGATKAEVRATRVKDSLVLAVSDDGVGGASPATGTGLEGIGDRLAALGGKLTVESPPGGGTRVLAELPCG